MKTTKKIVFITAFFFSSFLGHAQESPFFLSSEKIVQRKQASLNGCLSFVFFPLLKLEEKDAADIIQFIEQELRKAGIIMKRPILTHEGLNLDCFSNPSLQFLIERLVDQNNTPLPVLKAILSISTVVEISKTEELTSLETNRWSLYLKNTNNVQEAIEKSLPLLLQHFVANFQQANNTDQKPTFYIIYDSSWWRSLE